MSGCNFVGFHQVPYTVTDFTGKISLFHCGASLTLIYRVLELLKHRSVEFLAVTELRAELIFEYGDLGSVVAPVGKQQSEIGVNTVLRNAQGSVLSYCIYSTSFAA